MEEFRAVVSGRVQLVMFRDFTCRHARKYSVLGTVQNLRDGSVEVIAQGSRDALDHLIADLRKGPLLAKVGRVDVEWRTPQKEFDSFEIAY